MSHGYADPYVVANMPAIAGQANQVVQVIDQNSHPVLCLSAGACKGVLATWMAANRSHGVQGAAESLGHKLNSDGAGLLRLEDAIDQASATATSLLARRDPRGSQAFTQAKAMAGGGMRYRQTSRPQVDPRSTSATARNVLDMARSDGFYRLSMSDAYGQNGAHVVGLRLSRNPGECGLMDSNTGEVRVLSRDELEGVLARNLRAMNYLGHFNTMTLDEYSRS